MVPTSIVAAGPVNEKQKFATGAVGSAAGKAGVGAGSGTRVGVFVGIEAGMSDGGAGGAVGWWPTVGVWVACNGNARTDVG